MSIPAGVSVDPIEGASIVEKEDQQDEIFQSSSHSTRSSPDTPATAHSSSGRDSLDDIWLADDYHGTTTTEHGNNEHFAYIHSDVTRLRSIHVTAGYREGLAASRAGAVQPGFDEGYLLGSAVGVRAGWLKGIVECLVKAIVYSETPSELESAFRKQAETMHNELRMEELLGPSWIDDSGIWKWPVEGSQADTDPTIQTVASSHPVIQKWKRAVSNYCRLLGVAQPEPTEG